MKVHCETTEISPAVVQFSRLLAIFCGFEFSPCFWNDSRRRFPRQNPWSNYGGFELSDWYISKKKAGEDFGIVLECLGFGWRLDRVSPLRKRRGSGDSPGLQNRRLAPCGVNGAFDSHTLPPISSLLSLGIAQDFSSGPRNPRLARATVQWREAPQVDYRNNTNAPFQHHWPERGIPLLEKGQSGDKRRCNRAAVNYMCFPALLSSSETRDAPAGVGLTASPVTISCALTAFP